MKHIEIQDLYIRFLNAKGLIAIHYVPSEENWADLLTKAMKSADTFRTLRDVTLHGLRGGVRNGAYNHVSVTSA